MNTQVLFEEHQKMWLWTSGDYPVSFLNAVRRAIISSLPTYAIDRVDFYENTSSLFNEYLANRLGLIPFTFEESASGEVLLALDVEAVDEERTVYSGDLVSQDPVIKPFYTHIPLIKLGKGQRLRLEATARVGKAREHAKFQSALASYGFLDEIKLSQTCKKCGRAIRVREQFLLGKIPTSKIPEYSLVCEECEVKLDAPRNESIVFFVESYNNISARQQLFRALAEVEREGKNLLEVLK